ncbi:MAG: hypothetical protein ACJAQT_001726 [Akkermansiaceae bacterium]
MVDSTRIKLLPEGVTGEESEKGLVGWQKEMNTLQKSLQDELSEKEMDEVFAIICETREISERGVQRFRIKMVRSNPSDFVCLCDRVLVSTGTRFFVAEKFF